MGRSAVEGAQAELEQFQRAMELAGEALNPRMRTLQSLTPAKGLQRLHLLPRTRSRKQPRTCRRKIRQRTRRQRTQLAVRQSRVWNSSHLRMPLQPISSRSPRIVPAKSRGLGLRLRQRSSLLSPQNSVLQRSRNRLWKTPPQARKTKAETEPALTDEPASSNEQSQSEDRVEANAGVELNPEPENPLIAEPSETEPLSLFVPTSYERRSEMTGRPLRRRGKRFTAARV